MARKKTKAATADYFSVAFSMTAKESARTDGLPEIVLPLHDSQGADAILRLLSLRGPAVSILDEAADNLDWN